MIDHEEESELSDDEHNEIISETQNIFGFQKNYWLIFKKRFNEKNF